MHYRPDIDGLRAVAVLSVVLCHAGLGFSGGFIGVDVFFVISGYLITGLMLQDWDAGTFSLVRFWERRIRRILPALTVVLLASFVAGWFLLPPGAYTQFGRSVMSIVEMRSNVHFARGIDYFAPAAEEVPLLHIWSLSLEEQFYLTLPFLFWVVMRSRRTTWLGPLVGLAAIASFGYGLYGATFWNRQAYYLLATRAWELLAGVLTAIYARKSRSLSTVWRETAAMLGLTAVAIAGWCYDETTPFPGFAALAPVLGTVLLILSGGQEGRATAVSRFLASRVAVGIGLISYSFYLWHWPLLVFAKHYYLSFSMTPERLETTVRALLVAVSAALACVTYRYVEVPFRRRSLLLGRRQLFTAAAVATICLLAAGEAVRYSGGVPGRLPDQARLFLQTGVPDYAYFPRHPSITGPQDLKRFGAVDVEPSLLVWGDSHAMAVLPAIDELCRAAQIGVRSAVHISRPPLVTHHFGKPHEVAESNAFGATVLEYAQSPQIDAVLLASVWNVYFNGYPHFAESLLETVDELRAAGRRVYFLKDVPQYDYDVTASLISRSWHGRDLEKLSFSLEEYERQNRFQDGFLPQLRERGVVILDPIPLLRDPLHPNQIRPYDAGGCFFYDSNHLSTHGAMTVKPVFAPLIETIVAARSAPSSSPHVRRTPILTADGAREPLKTR